MSTDERVRRIQSLGWLRMTHLLLLCLSDLSVQWEHSQLCYWKRALVKSTFTTCSACKDYIAEMEEKTVLIKCRGSGDTSRNSPPSRLKTEEPFAWSESKWQSTQWWHWFARSLTSASRRLSFLELSTLKGDKTPTLVLYLKIWMDTGYSQMLYLDTLGL